MEQFRGAEVFPALDRMYYRVMTPLYCRRANAIITMTDMGVGEMVKYLGVDARKVAAIHESHNARFRVMEKEGLAEVRKKYGLPERFILFVGGLNPLKNFGGLLKAVHQLGGKIPHRLVAVGFKRWRFESDMALVKTLGWRSG